MGYSSITQILIFFKLVPFIILFLLHYFFGKTRKIVYYLYVFILTALYVHVWYFPLNGSTIRYVVLLLFGMLLFMTLGLVIFYVKVRSIRKTIIASVCCLGALFLITGAIFVSRTSYAITTFEMQALQKSKERKKECYFCQPSRLHAGSYLPQRQAAHLYLSFSWTKINRSFLATGSQAGKPSAQTHNRL